MCEKLILYLDTPPYYGCCTYQETLNNINGGYDVVITTQPAFLQFKYAKRLFVKVNGEEHEITLGKYEGIDREIKKFHNIEKMLLNGAFDWFR